jgi:hypothetical protein
MDWLRKTAQKVLSITHGRTTAFFMAFFVSGNVFHALHRLDHVYVEFMVGLGGLVIGHSWKEDKAEQMLGPRPPAGPDPMQGAPHA